MPESFAISAFGFRISDFGFPSDFGASGFGFLSPYGLTLEGSGVYLTS
jgi:hypothetical protein